MSGNTKVIFVMRGTYTTIDHISPVIDRWMEKKNAPTDLILVSGKKYLNNWQFELLESHDQLNIQYIDNILRDGKETTNMNKIVNTVKKAGRKAPTHIPEIAWKFVTKSSNSRSQNTTAKNFLNNISDGYDNVILVSEWPTRTGENHVLLRTIAREANKIGYPTIALPRADSAMYNPIQGDSLYQDLIKAEKFSSLPNDFYQFCFSEYERLNDFDYIVVPNHVMYRRVRSLVNKNMRSEDSIQIIGSARYNEFWLNKIPNRTIPYNINSDLDVVLFDRPSAYNITKEHVYRTIEMISQIPDVYLVLKKHPGGGLFEEKEVNKIKKMNNVKVFQDEIDSTTLLQWGDIFLDIGTSVTFEAVMKSKPVLELEYCHANHCTISHYINRSNMKNLEDLYYEILELKNNGCDNFYPQDQRDEFIDNIIKPTGSPVLDLYVDFISSKIN